MLKSRYRIAVKPEETHPSPLLSHFGTFKNLLAGILGVKCSPPWNTKFCILARARAHVHINWHFRSGGVAKKNATPLRREGQICLKNGSGSGEDALFRMAKKSKLFCALGASRPPEASKAPPKAPLRPPLEPQNQYNSMKIKYF